MAKKRVSAVAAVAASNDDNFLSAADFLSPPELIRLEVPELPKNGRPGIVHVRPIVAGDAIDEANATGAKPTADEFILKMLVVGVVHPDGSPMFTENDMRALRNMKLGAFNRLSAAVTGTDIGLLGKGSSEEAGGGSSTG